MIKKDLLISYLAKMNNLENELQENSEKIFTGFFMEGIDEDILDVLRQVDFEGVNIGKYILKNIKRNNLFEKNKISMNRFNIKVSSSIDSITKINYELSVKISLDEVIFIDLFNQTFDTKKEALERLFISLEEKAQRMLKEKAPEEYDYYYDIKLPRSQKESLLAIHYEYLNDTSLMNKNKYAKKMSNFIYQSDKAKNQRIKNYLKFLLMDDEKLIRINNRIEYDLKQVDKKLKDSIFETQKWIEENKNDIFKEINDMENFLISLGYSKKKQQYWS